MMRLPSLLLSALALGFAGVVIVPSIASAQDASMQEAFDSSRFRPSSVGSGGILVDGVVPGAPWELDGSLWFQAARRPLMYTVDGVVTDPVVSGRIGGFLSVGFTFGRWARLALDLPVTLYQQGENPQTGEALPTGGPGDLRLSELDRLQRGRRGVAHLGGLDGVDI